MRLRIVPRSSGVPGPGFFLGSQEQSLRPDFEPLRLGRFVHTGQQRNCYQECQPIRYHPKGMSALTIH